MQKLNRYIENKIVKSLKAFPVVYIAGPRQSGKTTLVRHIAETKHKAHYMTFDDLQTRSAAKNDPMAFLKGLKGNVVIDEVQMAPEIFRPLKIIVDKNREAKNKGRGRFLLTGSSNIMALPKLSSALVGRMILHTLYPFSASEISETPSHLIKKMFSRDWAFKNQKSMDIINILKGSSYPELFNLNNHEVNHEWCNSYLNTILQRDVRMLLEADKISSLPDMLHLFGTRTGGLLNEASISRNIDLNHLTIKKYRVLLENLFLILSIPAWSHNLGKRLIKAPKIYLADINLLSYLLNTDIADLPKINPRLFGSVLENFVAVELSKQLTFSDIRARLYYYRTSSGQEVDFILEGPENKICAVEVKAASALTHRDFRHLKKLQADLGQKMRNGFIIYTGDQITAFGDRLYAIPLSTLWRH